MPWALKTKQRLYSALERKRTRQNQVAHQDSMRDNKLRAGPEDVLSPFGEQGIVVGELMRLGLPARVAKPNAPVDICEKKKGWTSRNGLRSHGWLADVQRYTGCDKEMGLNAA
jgi:hypothetical protein